MHTFFHPWRRNLGYVALLSALALMAICLRSQLIADEISNRDSDYTLVTSGGFLFWSREENLIDGQDARMRQCFDTREPGWRWQSYPNDRMELEPNHTYQFSTRYCIPGAEFAVAMKRKTVDRITTVNTFSFWKVSLLWGILPATIISACLILWKPRPVPS